MRYRDNSLKEAIGSTLIQLNYNNNDTHIIKKLILNALSGKSEYFVETNKAREYISSRTSEELLKEMINDSGYSKNVDEIIEKYIINNFKSIDDTLQDIENNSNLDAINKKIRYISINSDDDKNFYNNVWAYFSKVFIGNENTNISSTELKNDMLIAAMKVAEETRDKVKVLKELDPLSENITISDSITLVDEYLHKGRIDELLYYINNNKMFSGALLQNLIDYTYFNKNKSETIESIVKLDNILSGLSSVQAKEKFLYDLITEVKHEDFGISKEEVITNLLKNSLSLYLYSKENTEMMYVGNNDRELNQIRKQTNDKLVEELIINGKNTNIDDIVNTYNNYNDQTLHFLTDTYVISRLSDHNKYRLNDLKHNTNNNATHVFSLLDSDELKEALKESNVKKAA